MENLKHHQFDVKFDYSRVKLPEMARPLILEPSDAPGSGDF